MTLNFINTIEIIETQELWSHIWIHEVKFKSYSETHYCLAAVLDLMCQEIKITIDAPVSPKGKIMIK